MSKCGASDSAKSQVTVRHYSPADKQDFVELNLDWIEEYFAVEESDREQLERLESSILGVGGRILVAELHGRVVGVGAIVPPPHYVPHDGRKWFEIVKFATRKSERGKGIGRAVVQALIETARAQKADGIWLETNQALASAVRLYERCGFRQLANADFWPTPYERCNVQMVLFLQKRRCSMGSDRQSETG